MKNSIYTCLWFEDQAEAAANFYCSVFKNSKITFKNRWLVNFELNGQKFMCLNGDTKFKINPSISFFVVCETVAEVDEIWNKLLDSGSVLMPIDKYEWSERYGWLQDRYGVNWQLSFGKIKDVGQKFTPTLMFVKEKAGKAEEAIQFYTSIFNNSSTIGIMRYSAEDQDIEGYIKHAQFTLDSHVFMAMDSSAEHNFSFNEAVSIVVECENQEKIDYFWSKLTGEGGKEGVCGWLKDKFGVSWQIVPSILGELMANPDRAERVIQAVMQMKKLDITKMENA